MNKNRAIPGVAMLFLLSACGPSKEERKVKFMTNCQVATYTAPQCEFLFAMSERAAEDSETALLVGISMNAATQGVAIGAAGGGRR